MKLLLIFLAVLSSDCVAGTVAGTGGATEITQILNNVELGNQTYELMQQTKELQDQLAKQEAMVADMQRQGKTITDAQWNASRYDLVKLAKVIREGQSLAYQSAYEDQAYQRKNEKYRAYVSNTTGSTDTLDARINEWSKLNMSATGSAMKTVDLQNADFSSESRAIQSLESLGKSTSGRMQAIQIGNQIALQQVSQVQKLRSLVMSQIQMQSSFQESQTIQNNVSRENDAQFLNFRFPTLGNGKKY